MSRRLRSGAAGLAGEIRSAPVTSSALRALRGEVAATLTRQHKQFAEAFGDALQQAFLEFTRPAVAKTPGQWLDLGAFEIMDESRIQEEIEVGQVLQILNEDCTVELRRLIKFEGALRRHEGVRVAASPIGPPCLSRALWTASEGLDIGAPARPELVRCVARWLAPRLSELYAAVRQAGFADASHLGGRSRDGSVGRRRHRHPAHRLRRHAARRLVRADGSRRAASRVRGVDVARAARAHPRHAADAARRRRRAHPRPDPQPPRGTGRAAGTPPVRAWASRCWAHLFVQIVADPALSNEAREWLARLQPVVVRLATQDATLLQSHRHPAWTLVNRIVTTMSVDKGAPAPEFMQWLADSMAQVAADPSTATFQAAVDRLTQWQRKQAQRRLTSASVEGALELLQRNASQEELVAQAKARLQRKLDSAHPPSQTRRFILTLWSLVVAQEWTSLPAEARRNSPAMDNRRRRHLVHRQGPLARRRAHAGGDGARTGRARDGRHGDGQAVRRDEEGLARPDRRDPPARDAATARRGGDRRSGHGGPRARRRTARRLRRRPRRVRRRTRRRRWPACRSATPSRCS